MRPVELQRSTPREYGTLLDEAGGFLRHARHDDIVSIKLRPLRHRPVEIDSSADAVTMDVLRAVSVDVFPSDYDEIARRLHLHGFDPRSTPTVGGARATHVNTPDAWELLYIPHETGPEVIATVGALVLGAGAAAFIVQLVGHLADRFRARPGGSRDAVVSIELRTKSGEHVINVVKMPRAGERLAIDVDDVRVSISSTLDAQATADFVILTAIEVERKAACEAFSFGDAQRDRKGSRVYWRGVAEIGEGKHYNVVVAQAADMANVDAALLTADAIHHWKPSAALMVGIAGGVDRGAHLGDIVVGTSVHYYERGKVTENGVRPEPKAFPADATLLNNARAVPEWKTRIPVARPDRKRKRPQVHYGVIASGEKVIAEVHARNAIAAVDRKILAIEMEGYGFSAAAWQSFERVRHIVIRGICDDGTPSKDDAWHRYAAAAAAGFARHFVLDGPIVLRA